MNMKQLVTLAICLLLILAAAQRSTAQKPELVLQSGHSDSVLSLAFSPDRKTLASGGRDETIKFWDVASGTLLRTLDADTGRVGSVAFSLDGKTLVSLGEHIKLWDVATGTELVRLEGESSQAREIALSPDGKMLASDSGREGIKLWDITSGKLVRTLTFRDTSVTSLAFSPDGKRLAIVGERNVGEDKTTTYTAIRLWDVTSGRELRARKGNFSAVSVSLSPDGRTLASGGNGSNIKLWNVANNTLIRLFKGHDDGITIVAFSVDSKTLAIGYDDYTTELWDVDRGTKLRVLKGHEDRVLALNFSPDGKMLASGSSDDTIKLWDVKTGTQLRSLAGHPRRVNSVAFSPDANTIASGSDDNTINLWEGNSGIGFRTLKGHAEAVESVAFSPAGKLLASGDRDGMINLWDVASGTPLRTFKAHYPRVSSVAFSPDGKLLASGGWDKVIRLWDVANNQLLRTFKASTGFILAVAFNHDGTILASGNWEGTITLWDINSGLKLRTLPVPSTISSINNCVNSVAFSPDGKMLAGGNLDHTVRLWDVTSGKQLFILKGHRDWVHSVTFSPDGKTLASGGEDGSTRLWDVATGTPLSTFDNNAGKVLSVAFSPDGKMLASGSSYGALKLRRMTDGVELAGLLALDENDWLVISPDGLFDGAPAAWRKIIWRFNNNTFDYAQAEVFFGEFYYPGLLADIFAGKRLQAPSNISQKDRRQSRLSLTTTHFQRGAGLEARDRSVKIAISDVAADKNHTESSGAQDVRLFRNGSLVKVWHGDVLNGNPSVTLEATIPIVAGENRLTAYAFNHDNIKSSDATLVVNGAKSLKRQGTAYILAIGVNNYSNSQYDLKYAVADAEDFSTEVKRQQETLKRYAKVEVTSLSNVDATKANITQKLSQLTTLVQPEDAVIVFFAGHGTAHGNQFYLIPHDLGYAGPRETLNEAGLQVILSHSISDRELEKLFEGIDAGQLLLVIDACNSGQALEAEEKRRGPMNSKGLAQLAYEKGMYVLTAAQSYQAAQEAAKFGHGFLTYALVEDGLKQGKADREPKDRAIDLREWLNYATEEVPKMQEENSLDALRGRGRYVVFVGDGSRSGDANKKDEARDNIQRPRIFYRRELDSNPLVVAVVGATSPQ